jgi:hypothetical protein
MDGVGCNHIGAPMRANLRVCQGAIADLRTEPQTTSAVLRVVRAKPFGGESHRPHALKAHDYYLVGRAGPTVGRTLSLAK